MVYTNRTGRNKRAGYGLGVTTAVLTMVLLCAATSSTASEVAEPRVRSTNATVLALVQEGIERSTTFNALVDSIGLSNGIVYVEFGYCAFGHLNGCLLPYIASTSADRYLRVVVTPNSHQRSHDQLLALIAHECGTHSR